MHACGVSSQGWTVHDSELKVRRRLGDDKYRYLMQVFHYFEDLLMNLVDVEDGYQTHHAQVCDVMRAVTTCDVTDVLSRAVEGCKGFSHAWHGQDREAARHRAGAIDAGGRRADATATSSSPSRKCRCMIYENEVVEHCVCKPSAVGAPPHDLSRCGPLIRWAWPRCSLLSVKSWSNAASAACLRQ